MKAASLLQEVFVLSMDAALRRHRMLSRVTRQGPGRRRYWPVKPSRYSGEDLRRIRAERGVGRPPKHLRAAR